MLIFLSLIIPIIVWGFLYLIAAAKLSDMEYSSYKHASLIVGGVVLLIQLALLGDFTSIRRDALMVSGRVTHKAQEQVSCEHRYQCGEDCSTSCDSKGHCRRTCVPRYCYEHMFDYDWRVYSNTGDYVNIDRIDRQGVSEPPRFTQARIGEPFVSHHGAQNSLLLKKEKFKTSATNRQHLIQKQLWKLPQSDIYDYYRPRRVWNYAGVPNEFIEKLKNNLNELLADNPKLPEERRTNITVLFAPDEVDGTDLLSGILEQWDGLRPNEILLVYGVHKHNDTHENHEHEHEEHVHFSWLQADTWAWGEGNNKMLADLKSQTLQRSGKPLSFEDVWSDIEFAKKHYQRLDDKAFKHLRDAYGNKARFWFLIIGSILQLAVLLYPFFRRSF